MKGNYDILKRQYLGMSTPTSLNNAPINVNPLGGGGGGSAGKGWGFDKF